MLVTFTSKAHGDITMFGDVAKYLLKIMGHSGAIPSAIFAEDVPLILERLQHAVETEEDVPLQDSPTDTDEDKPVEQRVSLAVRAFPLIEMLTAAAKENCNVMWYSNSKE